VICSNCKLAEKRQRSSVVWDHFDLDEDTKKVACKTCKATLAYNSTTSSMIKHIQAKHPYKMSTNEATAVELVTTLINVMFLILTSVFFYFTDTVEGFMDSITL
jgi:hypothetical protein